MIQITKVPVSNIFAKAGDLIKKHGPQIAGWLGIAGYIAAIGLTYRNAADIHEAVENRDYKKAAKKGAGIAVLTVAATAAEVYSLKTSAKQCAEAAAAHILANTAISEFKEATKEEVGDKKYEKIEERVVNNRLNDNPPDESQIIRTGTGNTLCYEYLTGRYFYGDINALKAGVNEVNTLYDRGESSVFLSDLYFEWNLPNNAIGSTYFWDVNTSRVKVDFSSHLSPNGTPCLAIKYRHMQMANPYTGDYIPVEYD